MRILHTADLHLGQIMYQYYDRVDEHDHYFDQLRTWCSQYRPDALVVSGDLFDIQQPGAATKSYFNQTFAALRRQFPDMAIVITAGNHDSASRIEADRAVWALSGVTLVGQQPAIVRLPSGYIIAVPYMAVHRSEVVQQLLDQVTLENDRQLPVVLMDHLAVSGSDCTGHSDIGTLKTVAPSELGSGYDYAALGHIHRPQTLGAPLGDESEPASSYPAPVIRYSGSPLHVSCDEQYPHSVSLVDLPAHGADITVQRLRIDELRHFYTLPQAGAPAAQSADEVLLSITEFCNNHDKGYLRLRIDSAAALPSDFQQNIYKMLELTHNEVRYNPNVIWENQRTADAEPQQQPTFEVAELQQMTDPLNFIRKIIDQYPNLDLAQLEADFDEVERMLKTIES